MTSFVNANHPTIHPGVERAEVLFDIVNGKRAGARHVVAFLLVAALSSALVVAEALVTNWDEGSLLAAWAVLCAALFAGTALYADVLAAGAKRVGKVFVAGAQRRANARADALFLASAERDPRIMQELRAAIERSKAESEVTEVAAAATPNLLTRMAGLHETPSLYVALARVQSGHFH
ncbi:hypothetical protein [Variovorax sp. dw_308]|uniref:hypothetical protein n=1 Tax=Variovorax sp. dw_308 TaxID=2721546 RepID=UPI001C467A85|nr:hypothetical protein [Variovorax sp. dw_308]